MSQPPPTLPPLLLGDVPCEGERLDTWEAFAAALTEAPRRIGVVEAARAENLTVWLKGAARTPRLVVLGGDEAALLAAGACEVLPADATPDQTQRAVVRTRARGLWRADAERFRTIVEHARDIVTVLDVHGRYVYVSPSVEDQLGFSPEALRGTSAFALLHEDDVHEVMDVFLEAISTPGTVRAVSYRVRRAGGEIRRLRAEGVALTGASGDPYAVVTSRDVTEQARAQAALRDSEARYRSLLDALPDVISRIGRDGRVLDFHVPPVFATEFPAEVLLGHVLQDEIPVPLAETFTRAVAQIGAGVPLPVTYRYEVTVAGEPRYREARIVPNGPNEVLSIVRDVTAEALAEQGVQRSQAELEASQADLRALAARLQDVREEERTRLSREVHDSLGQQLTAIRFAVGWFGRQLAGDDEAVRRLADARGIIDETIRLVRRISADLRPGVLDDFGLVTALEWFAERTAERTGLDVLVTASGDASGVPDEMATAAFRIVQEALTNVARHAEATSVRITVETTPEHLCVRVRDDGVGLDAEAVRQRRSLGVLGMRERARALGGTLRLSGASGEGATVLVTFPLPT